MVKEIDEKTKIYITDDLTEKIKVVEDLEAKKKVIIISSLDEILSIYGSIFEVYQNYNLYKVDDLEDVDAEYINEIKDAERTKEEAVMYIGKSLNERVIEVINRIECSKGDKIILGQVKEVLKGLSSDSKTKAEVSVLYKKNEDLQKENETLKYELNLYKTQKRNEDENSNTLSFVNDINIDILNGVYSKIIYIKELNRYRGLKTLLRQYVLSLKKKMGLNAKVVIFDKQVKYRYNEAEIIMDSNQYQTNRLGNREKDVLVLNGIYPYIITDTLTDTEWDVIILLDRICEKDIIKGKEVSKYVAVCSKTEYENYCKKENIENVMFIGDPEVVGDTGLTISIVNEDMTKPQMQYYVYSTMHNRGEDKRFLFDIINDRAKITKKTKGI